MKSAKEVLWGVGLAVCSLVLVCTGVVVLNALSDTPAPATAPCVAPSPPVAGR